MISKNYAYLLVSLALIEGLILRFGHVVGLSDVVVAGITGFIVAVIPFLLTVGYEDAKKKKEREEKRQELFKGIYIEISEFLEYFKDYPALGEEKIDFIPPLPHNAWDTAYTNGFIQPDDALCEKLAYAYRQASDMVYLTNVATQIWFSSNPAVPRVITNLQDPQRERTVRSIFDSMQNKNKSLIPILEEIRTEIETKCNIPPDEVNRIRENLKKQILSYSISISPRQALTQ